MCMFGLASKKISDRNAGLGAAIKNSGITKVAEELPESGVAKVAEKADNLGATKATKKAVKKATAGLGIARNY